MRRRLLFAAYMAGGNATILRNLQDFIEPRTDVDSAWLRIELDAESSRLDRRPRPPFIPGSIWNSVQTAREIRRQGGRFDAAYFFHQTICMLLFRYRRRVPYVIGVDGTPLWYARDGLWYALPRFDPSTFAARVKRRLLRDVFARAHRVLALSNACRRSVIEDYDIAPERVVVVPPGINLNTFRAVDRPERPFGLLFVGADFVRKGGDLLVQLAQEPEFAGVRFDFVTRAYQGPKLPNVRVFDGVTANSPQMLALMADADLFALPTRADTHAIASLESMATGLPVISTPVGGVPDVIADGETGYLIDRDDVSALRDRIRRLRDDRPLRLRMGAASRRRVEQRFDGEQIAAQVVELMLQAAQG